MALCSRRERLRAERGPERKKLRFLRFEHSSKRYAVVVSSGRFALLNSVESAVQGQPVEFKIEDFKFVAEGSYLSVDQGERVEICARRVVLEAGKAWVAARKEGDSALLWLDLADAGV